MTGEEHRQAACSGWETLTAATLNGSLNFRNIYINPCMKNSKHPRDLNVENHVLNIQYFTETGHFTVERNPLLYADDILGVNKVFKLYSYCIFILFLFYPNL